LPRYLPPEDVERVIASCESTTPNRYEGPCDSPPARTHGSSRGRHLPTSSG
jgi:hypothetical protein